MFTRLSSRLITRRPSLFTNGRVVPSIGRHSLLSFSSLAADFAKPEPKVTAYRGMQQAQSPVEFGQHTILTPYHAKTEGLQNTLKLVIGLVSAWCAAARSVGVPLAELELANNWTLKVATSTVSTVHCANAELVQMIREGLDIERELAVVVASHGCPIRAGAGPTEPNVDLSEMSNKQMEAFGTALALDTRRKIQEHETASALSEVATQGLKGGCVFAARCRHLESTVDDWVAEYIHDIYHQLGEEPEANSLKKLLLRVGKLNFHVLGKLDQEHRSMFGEPKPTAVQMFAHVRDKCILVSGHDMQVLHEVLKQTADTGVNVYTHGDLLSAHSYPVLQGFKHLTGHYETTPTNDFAHFPGPIVVARDRIFDSHKPNRAKRGNIHPSKAEKLIVGTDGADLPKIIEKALHMKHTASHSNDTPTTFHVTCHHHTVLKPLVSITADAIRSGELKRILLLVGGSESEFDISYFTALAHAAPQDSMILTAGCVKRGTIHNLDNQLAGTSDIPRILDLGHIHGVYSGMVFLKALAEELGGDLPLSVAMTHADQKDTAVLLALLNMGIQNIRLGPSHPDYVTPMIKDILANTHNILPAGDPKQDLAAMMQGK
jgi:hydroxylamine reductase